MLSKFYLSSFVALCFSVLSCSAFRRTAPDISPLEYTYTQFGGVPDQYDAIAFNTSGIKSYWWANFLHGDDGHDYCIVITSANAGPAETVSAVSITDITAGTHFGTAVNEPGQLSTSIFEGKSSVLQVGSTATDQFSQNFAIGNFSQVSFNLAYTAKGPNLYQGGSGSFVWGSGFAYAFDEPETLPTGQFKYAGKTVTVVPEESATWFDFQWGAGYAVGGWYDFVVLLENGIKLQVTVLHPYAAYKQASFANVLYPDGHMELWPVVNDTQPANSWVSPASNITYYHDYVVQIPAKNSVLYVHLPVEGGETGPVVNPVAANTIADTFAWYNGTWEGLPVQGYGIMELRNSAGCASYGAC